MATPLDQIAATLGFTLDELALNAAGKISSHQAWLSVRTAVGYSLLGLLAAAIGAVAVTAKVGVLARLSVVLPLALGTVFFGVTATRSAMAVAARRVLHAEGPLELRPSVRHNTTVAIGPFQDTLPDATRVLTVGARYRVHYLDRSGRFLSLEPVPAAGADAPGGGRQ